MNFTQISYESLNSRQKENYNFHKLAAVLADYGFTSIRLFDDWNGADFIAQHIDGISFLKIQLKGRLCIYKKYMGKDLYIAFPYDNDWYLYLHDPMVDYLLDNTKIGNTKSWLVEGGYSKGSLNNEELEYFKYFKI